MKTFRLLSVAALSLGLLLAFAVCAYTGDIATAMASLSAFAIGGFLMKDAAASNKVTHALPNGAATTQGATGIDLGHGAYGDVVADFEVLVTAPALVVGEAANGDVVTYSLEHDTDSAFGTVATIPGFASVLTQTGAGGVGAAAATAQVRLPVDVKRYVRLKTVKTGTGNATTKSASVELVY